jgi:hypothetical protein
MSRRADYRRLALPIAASLAVSALFIARTTFVVDGERYFSLVDDPMISMRYARNLSAGYGLVWNAGQAPVEGYTNFLWTLWMAALHLLPLPESKVALGVMLTGAALLAVHLVVVHRITTHLSDSPRAASIAVWLTALYYPLIYWALRGMEVGLVTVVLSASVLFALRISDGAKSRDVAALAALVAAGVLTRPDVLAPCALVAAFAVLMARADDRRAVAITLAAAIVITVGLHTAFRVVYYGDVLPNTYYLKVHGAPLAGRLARGYRGVFTIGALHLLVPFALAAGYMFVARRSVRYRGALLLAWLFVTACAYSAYVGGDVWDSMLYSNRYMTPAVPGLLILAALAIDRFVRADTVTPGALAAVVALLMVTSALIAMAPLVTHELPPTSLDERLRTIRALAVVLPVFCLPLLRRTRTVGAAVLTGSALVAINGFAFALWLGHNAFYVADDAWTTRYGLALRAATTDDATIAVTWAGAIPYFAHRPAIDLLGKSDRVVAMRARQPSAGFAPGHDKWDYAYSIGELRPDVVAQLWHATDDDVAAIERFGYRRIGPWVFVRNDSPRVDADALQRISCALLAGDPFVLGSATVSPPNRPELIAEYCRE